jgi:hypothetical protein
VPRTTHQALTEGAGKSSLLGQLAGFTPPFLASAGWYHDHNQTVLGQPPFDIRIEGGTEGGGGVDTGGAGLDALGRGLHSYTFQLHLIAFCGIGVQVGFV